MRLCPAQADQERFQLYMDATQLSQIAYNLELSRGQVRLMDESVQKVRAACRRVSV